MQNPIRSTKFSAQHLLRKLPRRLGLCVLCLAFATATVPPAYAQEPGAPLDPALGISTLRLWNGPAPGAKGDAALDIPTLTLLRPAHPNGTAIIVAPGGAYTHLATVLEGREPADRLATLGVTVFILKYRLGPTYLYPVPLEDARRAVRLVRSLAPQFGYAPDRIGMMGFSAGGHLAAMAGVAPEPGKPDAPDPIDRQSSNLNFMMLVYPWLNAMQPQVIPTHSSSSAPMINYCSVTQGLTPADCARLDPRYTPLAHVGPDTPPAILFHTSDDSVVPVSTSVEFYTAMHTAGRPVELHIFAHGPHGFGSGGIDPVLSAWPQLLQNWLAAGGWLTPAPPKK